MITTRSSAAGAGPALSLVAFFLLLAAASPLVIDPRLLAAAPVSQTLFLRCTTAGALVALLAAIAVGRAKLEVRDPVLIAGSIFVGVSLVAGLYGDAPIRSLLGGYQRMGGVVGAGYVLLLYVAARTAVPNRWWPHLLGAAFLVGTLAGTVALYQAVRPGSWLLWFPPTDLLPSGPFPNSGVLAAHLILTLFVGAWLLGRKGGRFRVLLALSMAIQLGAFALTGNMAATIALVATLAAVLLIGLAWRAAAAGSLPLARVAVMGGALVAAGICTVWIAGQLGLPLARRLTSVATIQGTIEVRSWFWKSAIENVGRQPFLGAGPENFNLVFNRNHRTPSFEVLATGYEDRAHNVVLEILSTTGVIGLAAWLALLAAVALQLRNAYRGGAVRRSEVLIFGGMMIAYGLYLQMWFVYLPSVVPLVFVIAYLGSVAPPPTGGGGSRRGGWAPAACAALALALLAFTGYRAVAVQRAARLAQPAFTATSAPRIAEQLERAIAVGAPEFGELGGIYANAIADLTPDVPYIRADSSRVRWARQALLNSDAALAEQIDRDPLNDRWYLTRGDLYVFGALLLGEGRLFDRAIESFEMAAALSPGRLTPHYRQVTTNLLLGRFEPAREALARVEQLGEDPAGAMVLRARMAVMENDDAAAAAAFRRAWSVEYWVGMAELQRYLDRLRTDGQVGVAAAAAAEYVEARYGDSTRPPVIADERLLAELPIWWLRASEPARAIAAAEDLASRIPAARPVADRFATDVRMGWGAVWRRVDSLEEGQRRFSGGGLTIYPGMQRR